MPAATPLPRGPSVLTLYGAEDLLTGPGCPVCRYTAEASGRYLGWFALEGHGEPAMITLLCDSLGMCARHTRRLMSQPGAAVRLTAVYRYVVTAARDRLGRPQPPAPCPACRHDDAAAGRALGTLLDGLEDTGLLHRYQELGGLCLPHLGAAAAAGRRRTRPALAETAREAIAAPGARAAWLAGGDRDAEVRAVLRRALPPPGAQVPGACPPCLAGAQAEQDALAQLPGLASDGPDPAFTLCACHLADAATALGESASLRRLLAWQERCLAGRLRTGPRGLRAGQRHRDPATGCTICRARQDAAGHALGQLSRTVQRPGAMALCVRHHLTLRLADPRSGKVLAGAAIDRADELIAELADAFDRNARARGLSAAPPAGSAAWRHAAAFLDGAVFGGCPPRLP